MGRGKTVRDFFRFSWEKGEVLKHSERFYENISEFDRSETGMKFMEKMYRDGRLTPGSEYHTMVENRLKAEGRM